MKQFTIATLIVALCMPLFAFVAVPQAEAACSYNGFINSNGKCAKSFKHSKSWTDDDDRPYTYGWGYGLFGNFNNRIDEDQLERIRELLALIEELRALLRGDSSDATEFNVLTRSATNIEDDSATLRGRLTLDEDDTIDVWFVYGTSRSDLSEKTTEVSVDDDEDFSRSISGLDDNRTYYYRAVGENDDGDKDFGTIMSFRTTDNNQNDEAPDVETGEAEDITDDSAELHGSVDMNDFLNGRVFFVYGEDENQVEDVADDYDTYNEIDEDGNDLQKVLIDSDLDGDENYSYDVDGLDSDTDHYYRICVEYEDEDADDTILCGGVENFTTEE